MRRTGLILAAIGVMTLGMGAAFGAARLAEKPKHSISDVMKLAHGKDGILKKVKAGSASDAEKKELLDLYVSLTESEAPVGDAKEWEQRTAATVVAAAKVLVGREDAMKALGKATSCAGCHKAHKPKD